jgi:hypothetical protein
MWGTLLVWNTSSSADLLRNSSFENVPGPAFGQGILPSDFATAGGPFLVGADTYSNDGSFGLSPSEFGNFPGIVALEGIRFVAAAEFGGVKEAFGQQLTTPLSSQGVYRFSAGLLQSPRFPTAGGFSLILSPSISLFDPEAEVVGQLSATSAIGIWQDRSVDFVAPSGSGNLSYLILAPFATGPDTAYIAIDRMNLVAVPEASSVILTGIILLLVGTWIVRHRRLLTK